MRQIDLTNSSKKMRLKGQDFHISSHPNVLKNAFRLLFREEQLKIKMAIRIYTTIILYIIFSEFSYAQFGSVGVTDARSLGMGKANSAIVEGIFSLGINPANLIFSDEESIDFTSIIPLPSASVRSGTNFLSINDINYYFGGIGGNDKVLTQSDKDNLNELFENGGEFVSSGRVALLSVHYRSTKSIGSFAFRINDFVGGEFIFPEDLSNISFSESRLYDFSDARVRTWWIRDYSLTYAKDLDEIKPDFFSRLGFGITAKYYQGFAYLATEEIGTYLQTQSSGNITGEANLLAYSSFSDNLGVKYDFEEVDREGDFSLFPSPSGKGFGFDFGFVAELNSSTRLALSVTDIGKINWTKNVARFLSEGDITVTDITDKSQRDSVFDKIYGTAVPISQLTTNLPTALRVGFAHLISDGDPINTAGSILLAFDYSQGFNEQPGNTVTPKFSLGMEWKPFIAKFYVRTGFEFGGVEGINWAYGLGYDAYLVEFHLATNYMQTSLFPQQSKQISLSFSSRWKL